MSGIMLMMVGRSPNAFTFTISSNQTNANLATLATSAGWNGTAALTATINSGVYISSNSTATPALTVNGSFPNGVTLINNGYIVGMGGNGGSGASNGGYVYGNGMAGSSGGLALSVSSAVTINNTSGTIAGGGGGGGGGGAYLGAPCTPSRLGGAGGGGRSSNAANSTGGYAYGIGYAGSGTVSSAGSGINGLAENGAGAPATTGGNGGGWGSSGSSGTSPYYAGGAGGAGGGAVSGNSNITWLATGTRLGSIT